MSEFEVKAKQLKRNVDDEKKEVLKKILSLVEWRLGTESIL